MVDIIQINTNDGKNKGELFNIIYELESQWRPSMVDNVFQLEVYVEKIYDMALIYGVFVNDKIVGVAAFYANDDRFHQAYLTYIAFFEDFCKQGFGTKALAFCEKMASEKGMQYMKLEVKKHNKRAINFYEKNGYRYMNDSDKKSQYMGKRLIDSEEEKK